MSRSRAPVFPICYNSGMRHPQVLILAFDDWLLKQLTEFANEHKWLLKETRQFGACLNLLKEPRPTVLIAQIDPHGDNTQAALQFLIELKRHPSVATVVVSDVKLSEDDRTAWTATVMDFGARYVLFPPLSRPVLEDLVGGLMGSLLTSVAKSQKAVMPELLHQRKPSEDVIDLAEEGAAE
jgi:hypothetical protein